MSLTREDVEKVSLLARLRLRDSELSMMTDQLGQIVEYIDQLARVNTDNVEPMAHAMEIHNVFRDDEQCDSLDRELALSSAPKRDDECYRVPAVLGE